MRPGGAGCRARHRRGSGRVDDGCRGPCRRCGETLRATSHRPARASPSAGAGRRADRSRRGHARQLRRPVRVERRPAAAGARDCPAHRHDPRRRRQSLPRVRRCSRPSPTPDSAASRTHGGAGRLGGEYLGGVDSSTRPYGRRAFLLLLAGGLSSLAWASKVSGVVSPFTSSVSQLLGNLLPVGGWRIYTISGSMPIFDPNDATGSRSPASSQAADASTYDELRALPHAHQVSTFHCVTGWTVDGVRWSGVRFAAPARPRRAAASGEGGALRLARGALRRLAHGRPGAAARRDARARAWTVQPLSRPHGAPVRVVIPEMYGYKGVKWLTRIELVATSRPATGKSSATTRTPGSAARMATPSSRRPPAAALQRGPSARSTGSTRPRSASCSGRASASTCRASPSSSAGARC